MGERGFGEGALGRAKRAHLARVRPRLPDIFVLGGLSRWNRLRQAAHGHDRVFRETRPIFHQNEVSRGDAVMQSKRSLARRPIPFRILIAGSIVGPEALAAAAAKKGVRPLNVFGSGRAGVIMIA